MFPSRLLIAFLIPLVVLGLGIWFTATAEINRGSVRVAGALVGQPDVDLSVRECYLQEEGGSRNLTVVLEAHNRGSIDLNMDPPLFQLVLSHTADPLGETRPQSIYSPLRFESYCEQSPSSFSHIPPWSTRSYTLVFWGRYLPSGEARKDHYLSLEYYDPASSLLLSKLLNPEER